MSVTKVLFLCLRHICEWLASADADNLDADAATVGLSLFNLFIFFLLFLLLLLLLLLLTALLLLSLLPSLFGSSPLLIMPSLLKLPLFVRWSVVAADCVVFLFFIRFRISLFVTTVVGTFFHHDAISIVPSMST